MTIKKNLRPSTNLEFFSRMATQNIASGNPCVTTITPLLKTGFSGFHLSNKSLSMQRLLLACGMVLQSEVKFDSVSCRGGADEKRRTRSPTATAFPSMFQNALGKGRGAKQPLQ